MRQFGYIVWYSNFAPFFLLGMNIIYILVPYSFDHVEACVAPDSPYIKDYMIPNRVYGPYNILW